jgi:hypothetical protein
MTSFCGPVVLFRAGAVCQFQNIWSLSHFCCGTFQQASVNGIGSLLFSKALAASAFAIIAVLAIYEVSTGSAAVVNVVIAAIATLCALGFAFSAWADK